MCVRNYRIFHYQNNKELYADYSSKYYQDNKVRLDVNHSDYYEINKEEIAAYQKQYREAHKEEKAIYDKNYQSNRGKIDISFSIRKRVSNSIRTAIRRNGGIKQGSILKYLPYTIQELKEHLEKQFEPWMSWNNWGLYNKETWNDNDQSTWTWQIDHIIPQSKLAYTSMEDENFKECWALDNLRPLSAKQNLSDSNRKLEN